MLDNTFKAIVVEENSKGLFKQSIKSRNISDLPDGDILVKVKYSSLNYKDGLSFYGNKELAVIILTHLGSMLWVRLRVQILLILK